MPKLPSGGWKEHTWNANLHGNYSEKTKSQITKKYNALIAEGFSEEDAKKAIEDEFQDDLEKESNRMAEEREVVLKEEEVIYDYNDNLLAGNFDLKDKIKLVGPKIIISYMKVGKVSGSGLIIPQMEVYETEGGRTKARPSSNDFNTALMVVRAVGEECSDETKETFKPGTKVAIAASFSVLQSQTSYNRSDLPLKGENIFIINEAMITRAFDFIYIDEETDIK